MKIVKKLKKRYTEFKRHPVTSYFPIGAFYRYVYFNVKVLFLKECKYNWINGLKFIARKGDAGIVSNIYHGLYEFEDSIFLLHYTKSSDIFFDIGANLGHYSLILSGSKNCLSYSFEPVPETFSQLKKQVLHNKLDDKISIFNLGFSNQTGFLYFSTDKGVMNHIVSDQEEKSIQIPVTTLDDWCKTVQPTIMKVDVEGFEKFVIEGGIQTINNTNLKVILIEFNKSGNKYGVKDEEVYQRLLDFGFLPYAYNYQTKELLLLEKYNSNKFNTLMVRDLAFVNKRLQSNYRVKIFSKCY